MTATDESATSGYTSSGTSDSTPPHHVSGSMAPLHSWQDDAEKLGGMHDRHWSNTPDGGTDNAGCDSSMFTREQMFHFFWLCIGFRHTPSTRIIRLLATYAISASMMLMINRHLAQNSDIDAIVLVDIQLGSSLGIIFFLRCFDLIPLPLHKGDGPSEIWMWALLAVAFAGQLIGSLRTLQTHDILEWYLLLHYVTPCVVPLLERRMPTTDSMDDRPPLEVLIFPTVTLLFAVGWSYFTTGLLGPGTLLGFWWSMAWALCRILSVVGTRVVFLQYKTPTWNGLLYQNAASCMLFTLGLTVTPDLLLKYELTSEQGIDSFPSTSNSWEVWTVVAVSCVCGVVVTYVRLAILAETTASTFAVFGSVALMPVRVWYSSSALFGNND